MHYEAAKRDTVNIHHKTSADILLEQEQVMAARVNPAMFDKLYDKYYKPIFVFIYKRTLNEDLTADITSLVFLKAMINLKKYEFRSVPFSAWLFRIAFNEINMYFRRSKATRIVSFDQVHINTIFDEAEIEDDNEELKTKLLKALSKLPEDSMQLIELRFFEKLSFKEIGTLLEITENNAKVKLYRVLDKIKQLILK